MTAAELRQQLTLARRDITDAACDSTLPESEVLRLRWKACKLSGLLELAERAEHNGREAIV